MIYESDYSVGSELNSDSLVHSNYYGSEYWATDFDFSGNALSHHGVPNQKWGVRNGPPYPVQRGRDVRYNVGKMTEKTKAGLQKAGKITASGAKAVGNAVKSGGSKISSSFKKWKESKKTELAIKPTDSALLKNWQKKQLRISDMSNQELQQRIDRKRLEESYKRALRGDFSDAKTWNKAAKDAKSSGGKKAADMVLSKIGMAAVEGLASGLSTKISQSMTKKSEGKIARREARRNAVNEIKKEARAERAQFRAERRNADWKNRKAASYENAVNPDIRRDYYARLHSGNSDMDDLWNRVGPAI